jgi:hypothetical protein
VLGEQLRQDVLTLGTAESHMGFPGEVVEAHMVQVHIGGGDPQHSGELPLESDRHVAQSDRLVAGLEQGAGDDADGVGEVDDPGVRVGTPYALGDVEHHRNRTQRLREAARPGRLLADATALQRPGLVLVASGLSADAELEQHGVGAVDTRVEVVGRGDAPGVPLLGEDAPGQTADEFEPVEGRVDEDQFLYGQGVPQPRESVDEFRGVGGTPAHYCEFHRVASVDTPAFTPERNRTSAEQGKEL